MNDVVAVIPDNPKQVMFAERRYTNEERNEREEKELEALIAENKGETEEVKPDPEEAEEPANAEEKSFKKRYGDLRRHMQKKEDEFQEQLDGLKSQLSKATQQEIKLPKSDEDLDAWMKEYPDVADIVKTIAMKTNAEQAEYYETRLAEIDKKQSKVDEATAASELAALHPDFEDIKDSDAFHDWVELQPKWVQDALYENAHDAYSAGRAIDLYKADMKIKAKPKASETAASAVDTRATRVQPDDDSGSGKLLESFVDAQDMDWYEKNKTKVHEAIQSGNFIYDVTGGAR